MSGNETASGCLGILKRIKAAVLDQWFATLNRFDFDLIGSDRISGGPSFSVTFLLLIVLLELKHWPTH